MQEIKVSKKKITTKLRKLLKEKREIVLTLQELYPNMQKEVDSIKRVKSLARNTQLFRFPRVVMMTPPKRCLKLKH